MRLQKGLFQIFQTVQFFKLFKYKTAVIETKEELKLKTNFENVRVNAS
jgi:hypothetical protein